MGLLFLLLFSVLAGALINVGESASPARSDSDAYATILSPQSWTYVTNPVNVTVRGSPHYWGINRVEYKVDNNPWVPLYEYSGSDGPHIVTESVSVNLSRGVQKVHARVTAFAFYDVYYQTFAVDIVPTYIAVLSPENKTYNPK
jgi:hypothetical protein